MELNLLVTAVMEEVMGQLRSLGLIKGGVTAARSKPARLSSDNMFRQLNL